MQIKRIFFNTVENYTGLGPLLNGKCLWANVVLTFVTPGPHLNIGKVHNKCFMKPTEMEGSANKEATSWQTALLSALPETSISPRSFNKQDKGDDFIQ